MCRVSHLKAVSTFICGRKEGFSALTLNLSCSSVPTRVLTFFFLRLETCLEGDLSAEVHVVIKAEGEKLKIIDKIGIFGSTATII